jgi:hypothetical protein
MTLSHADRAQAFSSSTMRLCEDVVPRLYRAAHARSLFGHPLPDRSASLSERGAQHALLALGQLRDPVGAENSGRERRLRRCQPEGRGLTG